MEKYSSGRRGAPAKGIGCESGARVRIPPSPFFNPVFLNTGFFILASDFFHLNTCL